MLKYLSRFVESFSSVAQNLATDLPGILVLDQDYSYLFNIVKFIVQIKSSSAFVLQHCQTLINQKFCF